MGSIVLELQRDVLDSSLRVPDLLRKALVVARKLQITEFDAWITKELYGYQNTDEIPDYRLIEGEVKIRHPRHGWVAVEFETPAIAKHMSRRFTKQPISEIEALVAGANNSTELRMPFPKEIETRLMSSIRAPSPPMLLIAATQMVGVIDTVRNIVLNWSLRLEHDGILGEGLSFSLEEKILAAQQIYHINNFFGSVTGSQTEINAGRDVTVSGDVTGRDKTVSA
jgi:hypothetical protein